MATDNIVKVRIGVPGPPGTGVTAAEKASFVTLSAANVFTANQTIQDDHTDALLVEEAAGVDVFKVDTMNKDVELWAGYDLVGYSDAGLTQQWEIDGATGNATLDNVTVNKIIGEQSVWALVLNGGGSPIVIGVYDDIAIPYNANIFRWDMFANVSTTSVIDLWSAAYASFPPTNTHSITTGEEPWLSAATKSQDTSLNAGNGWNVTMGNVLRINVDNNNNATRITILLWVEKT